MSNLVEQITALIEPAITSMGYVLVQVKFMDSNKGKTLQIMAERADGTMGIDDCTAINNQVSAILDVEDVIPNAYRLEISSPGIDRPLVKLEDYAKFAGHSAKIETQMPVSGRKRFTGEILPLVDNMVQLLVDNKPVAIPFLDIAGAKLVLTEKLIKEAGSRQSPDISKKKEKV